MKVECTVRTAEKRREANDVSSMKTRIWQKTLPFNVNPRGVLIHRVRCAGSCVFNGTHSHDWAHYWCDNQTNGEGVNLTDIPPADRLLCSHCERKAVEAG